MEPPIPSPTPGVPPAGGPLTVPPPPGAEDASAQALSEALRSSFQIVKWLMAALVVLFLCSGVFVVPQDQVAVVLRFGKPVGVGADQLLPPGWHWAWPYPIDEKVRIRVGQSHTVTSTTGWHATTPELEAQNKDPEPKGFLSPEADGYTLTADANIIHVRATIKYRISDPLRYTFGFANVTDILTNVVNHAIFYASARYRADDALFKDKTSFRDLVIDRVKQKIDELRLGVSLEPSDVETKAPADVKEAFDKVTAAELDRSKVVSEARRQFDETTLKAVGEAKAIISDGLVSSNRLVQAVAAEASAFKDQLPRFLENRQLFERRLLAQAMERILKNTNVTAKFVLPENLGELRLQLSREPERRETKDQP